MYILYLFTSLSLNNDAVGAPHIHTCTHTYRNVITCTCTCKRPPCICIHSLTDTSTYPSYNRHYSHTSGISRTCKHPHSHTHTHMNILPHKFNITHILKLTHSRTHARIHSFRWYKNNKELRYADGPILQIPSAHYSDSGVYCCSISNKFGSVLSNNSLVKVTQVRGTLLHNYITVRIIHAYIRMYMY